MATMLGALSERYLRGAVSVLQSLADESTDRQSFTIAALEKLTELVSSDLTTLSICDLEHGARRVIGRQGEALSEADRAAFDRHFHEHPLVRFHGSHPGGPTRRITDCVATTAFRNSALHADYYRRIGINYVMALPLWIDQDNVISVVFNRSRSDFKDAERAVLDAVRLPLAAIYRNLVACELAGVALKCVGELAATGGWTMMRVTLRGRILEASPAALSLLKRFFPRHETGRDTEFPQTLYAWFSRSRNWGLERPAISHGQQFTTSQSELASPRISFPILKMLHRISADEERAWRRNRRGTFRAAVDGAGTRDPRPGGGRQDQRRDRAARRHQRADRSKAFGTHFSKARRRNAHGSRGSRAGSLRRGRPVIRDWRRPFSAHSHTPICVFGRQ